MRKEEFRRITEGIKVEKKFRGLVMDAVIDFLGQTTFDHPEYLEPEEFNIKVKKIPEGPAPRRIRKNWLGVEISGAHRMRSETPEHNFVRQRVYRDRRQAIAVPTGRALAALAERSRSAAHWFIERNVPVWLSFGEDEVEIIPEEKSAEPFYFSFPVVSG